MNGKYDDMLYLPHHVSDKHPQMSRHDRAAQFSPFRALTGYEDVIQETVRETDSRIELDETARSELNEKLRLLADALPNQIPVSITYFQEDARKDGGAYLLASGAVKRIYDVEKVVLMTDGARIVMDDIIAITGIQIYKPFEEGI